jgi:hypothetical protein
MAGKIIIALQITGIGMGLVFGAIILLWILIVIIVRSTTEIEKGPTILAASNIEQRELYAKIAIAATTAAILSEGEAAPHEFPLPATALVSAWQAVMRTDMLKKRGKTR